MLLKLDAIGAGRLFSKNLSSEDADVVAENTAVENTASKTSNVIIDKCVFVFFLTSKILFGEFESGVFIVIVSLISLLNFFGNFLTAKLVNRCIKLHTS